MAIRLTTLGGLRIRRDDRELDALLGQRLRVALFVHLAVERRVARDELLTVFWPESDEDHARQALRQGIYHLRRTIGRRSIASHAHELRIGDVVRTDVAAFEVALERGDLEVACRLYQGPFLAGIHLLDLPEWEHWVAARRATLARRFRVACRDLVEVRRSAGDLPGAVETARRWVAPDPLDDEAQHRLIQLLAEGGERADALRQFEGYEGLLESEGLRPLDETLELVEELRSSPGRWPAGAPPSGPAPAPSPPTRAPSPPGIPPPGVPAGAPGGPGVGGERPRGPPLPGFPGPSWTQLGAVMVAVIAMAALAAALLAGLPGISLLRSAPLDAERVVVYPLARTDPGSAGAGEGWDVALAIGAAFDHAEPLRWIDGRAWLPQAEREDPSRITPALARGIARNRGARYYLDGAIRGPPDRPAVVLRLHDVEGDSLVAQGAASDPGGGEGGLAGLGLRAALDVLQPLLAPGVSVDLGPIADREAGAIALWIRGESAYRTARFAGALDLFQRALEQDSLLAFAAVKGALAAGWLHREADMARLLEISRRNEPLLPPKYRLLSQGLAEMAAGRATAAVDAFESAVRIDPTWADGWMALAEARYHLLPGTLHHPTGAGEADAVEAFREALALDEGFVPPMLHLAEHLGRRGSPAEVEELLTRLDRAGTQGMSTGWVRLLLDCRRHALEGFQRGPNLQDVGEASRALAIGASHPRCAEAGFQRILRDPGSSAGERWGGLMGLNGVLLAQGRFHDSGALLDRALAEGLPGVHALRLFSALAGAPFQEEALRSVEIYRQVFGDHYQGAPAEARWLLGLWHARHGEPGLARDLASRLEGEADDGAPPFLGVLGRALSAHAHLAEGDRDAAEAILGELASAHPPTALAWGLAAPLPFERLALAELLLSRGRFAEAYAVAAVLDHPQPNAFVPLVPASLRIRAEAADGLGRSRVAAEHRGRLAALGWTDDGTPSLVGNP